MAEEAIFAQFAEKLGVNYARSTEAWGSGAVTSIAYLLQP